MFGHNFLNTSENTQPATRTHKIISLRIKKKKDPDGYTKMAIFSHPLAFKKDSFYPWLFKSNMGKIVNSLRGRGSCQAEMKVEKKIKTRAGRRGRGRKGKRRLFCMKIKPGGGAHSYPGRAGHLSSFLMA